MSEELKTWWDSLSDREQSLSLISVVFIVLAIIYWGMWKPLANQLSESEKQLISAQQTQLWVEDKASLLVESGIGKQGNGVGEQSLIQIVNSSAKQYGINFSRVENKNDQIEVSISDVEFDHFIRWLSALNNQYFVSILTTDISKIATPGHIKVTRLLLTN